MKELTVKRMNILDQMKAEGKVEGKVEGLLEGETNGILKTLHSLVNDPNSKYTAKELSEKFGFSEEQIIKGE